jgi:hypothetical protein
VIEDNIILISILAEEEEKYEDKTVMLLTCKYAV